MKYIVPFLFLSACSVNAERIEVDAKRHYDLCPKVKTGITVADTALMTECFKYCTTCMYQEAREKCEKMIINFFFPAKK